MEEIEKPKYLIPFLKSWLTWAEAGAQTDDYHEDFGLCFNYNQYQCYCQDQDGSTFYHWLPTLFNGDNYPFGVDISYQYHLNPRRLEWVREQIAGAE